MQEENKDAFVKGDVRSIFGALNGIICYDYIWPYVIVFLMQIILGDKYFSLVNSHYGTISLILTIVVSLVTIGVAIAIANPKLLIKAYKKFNKEHVKTIFLGLLFMYAFNFFYNILLVIFGVDITGGNANQETVVSYIFENAWLAFLAMVIIAPISEEITYRYFVFGGIRKYNKTVAFIVSGFIFMGVHAIASFTSEGTDIVRELLLLPPYLFSGLVLAYSYDKTSNLAVSTSIHMLNNLLSFAVTFL